MPPEGLRLRRRFVTLIAGLKCHDGFVLCADSQETVGHHRVARQKLSPKRCGNFDVAIAGSGENGKLVDECVERLQESIGDASAMHSLAELRKFLQTELKDFYKTDAAAYSRKDRDMAFIIGARSLDPPSCVVWKTAVSSLSEVDAFAITGDEDYRYEYLLKHLYRDGITMAQGVFLALHLMSLAEETSNSVKSPVSMVLLKDSVMKLEAADEISEMLQRVVLFEAQVDTFFLTCSDTGLQPQQFKEKFEEFIKTVVHLRSEYFEASLREKVAQGLQVDHMFNLIPAGTTITFHTTNQEQTALRQTEKDLVAALRADENGKQDYCRILANLTAIRIHWEDIQIHRVSGGVEPSSDVAMKSLHAQGEIMQAAFMGPYKISQFAYNALNRFSSFMNAMFDMGFGPNENLRLQLMALTQCEETIQREADSTPPAPGSIGAAPQTAGRKSQISWVKQAK